VRTPVWKFHAVLPAMQPELASIGVDAMPYKLFQLITAEGAVKIIPCCRLISTAAMDPHP
jgi:hypothetical protein